MKVFNDVELSILTPLKTDFSNTACQLALHPCHPFLVNNGNITVNIADRHYWVSDAVSNVKLPEKTIFKTFYVKHNNIKLL